MKRVISYFVDSDGWLVVDIKFRKKVDENIAELIEFFVQEVFNVINIPDDEPNKRILEFETSFRIGRDDASDKTVDEIIEKIEDFIISKELELDVIINKAKELQEKLEKLEEK